MCAPLTQGPNQCPHILASKLTICRLHAPGPLVDWGGGVPSTVGWGHAALHAALMQAACPLYLAHLLVKRSRRTEAPVLDGGSADAPAVTRRCASELCAHKVVRDDRRATEAGARPAHAQLAGSARTCTHASGQQLRSSAPLLDGGRPAAGSCAHACPCRRPMSWLATAIRRGHPPLRRLRTSTGTPPAVQ
jgi:hypothetical protein